MKILTTICLLLFAIPTEDSPNNYWQFGDILYQAADYKGELPLKTRMQLTGLKKVVKRCFCDNPPANLPGLDQKITQQSEYEVYIEPQIINTANCDGLYTKRSYHKQTSARYLNGFPHHLFLISDGQYFEFSSDSTYNQALFAKEEAQLKKSFTEEELNTIKGFLGQNTIWSDFYVILPPLLIKKNDKVTFQLN